MRADQYWRECRFLVTAHGIEQVVMLFHGPAADGPAEAICGDYRRKLPRWTPAEIRAQQERDAVRLREPRFWRGIEVRLHVYRCEVTADKQIQFVGLDALSRQAKAK